MRQQRPADASASAGRFIVDGISSCFLAYPVPADPALRRLIGDIPAPFEAVHFDDLHLTLAFLGPQSPASLEHVWRAVMTTPPPPVQLEGQALEGFGHPQRPRTLALSFAPAPRLLDWLNDNLGDLLRLSGRPAETRSPKPHVSLARLSRQAQVAKETWTGLPDPTACHLTLNHLALYGRQRDAQRDAPQYRRLIETRL